VSAERRSIRKRDHKFLKRELEYWLQGGLLDERQALALANLYEPAKGHFSQVLMGLGATLIGLGFLSYVAANWMFLNWMFKVGSILACY
jgi:uncharacterized membrane protein